MGRPIMLVLAMLVATSAFAGDVSVLLELRPSTILPGTSANVRAEVLNQSATAIVLRNRVALEVVNAKGDKFLAQPSAMIDSPSYLLIPREFLTDQPSERVPAVTLPAGGSLQFEIPFSHATTFFNDERLSFPGRYRLRLGLVTDDDVELWSNEVILEVQEPQGVDRDVWLRMLEINRNSGWSWSDWVTERFGDEVWEKHRSSAYIQYAIGPEHEGRPDWVQKREFGMKGPQRDYILLHEAEESVSAYRHALDARDHAAAKRAMDESKTLFDRLIATSNDRYVKIAAQRKRDGLPSQQRIQEIIRSLEEAERDRPKQSKIDPFVTCVQQGPGSQWTAWLGYENELEYELWLGTKTGENKFEPKPHERGQPQSFKQGRHERAFSVAFDGQPLTWFVHGEKATVTKTFQTQCK